MYNENKVSFLGGGGDRLTVQAFAIKVFLEATFQAIQQVLRVLFPFTFSIVSSDIVWLAGLNHYSQGGLARLL